MKNGPGDIIKQDKNNGFVLFRFPKKENILQQLNLLIELGEIETLEETKNELTVLASAEDREALYQTLSRALPREKWEEEFLEDRDWNREWIEGFQPIRIGRKFWVTPPWHSKMIPAGHEAIIINPANAFGTGTHESTRLALKCMLQMIRPEDRVLDLGCGSGILSIAARKMGAASVHAVDNDPEIENNLSENIERNHLDQISWRIADILELDSFPGDLALINIQKHIILPLLGRFSIAKETPNRVILAGLLNSHRKDIKQALKQQGYRVVQVLRMNEWIAVSAVSRRINEK